MGNIKQAGGSEHLIFLRYYSYRPRLSLCLEVDIFPPMVGDEISVNTEDFDELGKEFRSEPYIYFEVISRKHNMYFHAGPVLEIWLKLIEK